MKRYFVLLVVLSFVVSCFAFPASASNLNFDSWFDAFDYLVHDRMIFRDDGWFTFAETYFRFPFELPLYSFEMIIYDYWLLYDDYGKELEFFFRDDDDLYYALESQYIGDGYYRVYGTTGNPDFMDTFTLEVEFSSETNMCKFYIQSFYINTTPIVPQLIEGYCSIATPGYDREIHYVPTDEINHRQWVGSADYTDPYMMLELRTDEWKKYDYIDYTLFLECYSVTSIAAYFDGQFIPLDYGYLDNSYTGVKGFTITLRIDLRGIDRFVDSYPAIHINCQETPEQVNSVAVLSIVGGVLSEPPDPNKTWFQKIIDSLINFGSDAEEQVDDFKHDVQDIDKEMTDLRDDLNSATGPDIDSIDSNVNDFVSGSDLVLASEGLGTLIENPIIISVFSMSLLLCLASYVFFGKK